jgi:hypothetical protein
MKFRAWCSVFLVSARSGLLIAFVLKLLINKHSLTYYLEEFSDNVVALTEMETYHVSIKFHENAYFNKEGLHEAQSIPRLSRSILIIVGVNSWNTTAQRVYV